VEERQDFAHSEILFPRLQHIEATAIQLNINEESIVLISVYNHPAKIIERNLDLITGTGHKVILAGDFNVKHVTWRTRQNKAARQSLLNHCYKNNHINSTPSQPTHFPDRNPAGAEI
jgi:hypothetical protein